MKKVHGFWIASLVVLTLLAAPLAADITKVVNGASFASNNTFSPGSIITIKGTQLSATTAAASDPLALPKTLGGTTVSVGGIACALFYVSPKQVNAQIDPAVPLGMQTLLLSSPAGAFSAQVEIVKAGAPGIFSMEGTGTRDGAILNAVTFARGPFSVTTAGQPTYLAIYTTGLDLSTTPKVTIDGVNVPVIWAGNAPGFTGLQQINVQLLDQLAGAGRVDVMVVAGGRSTNVVEAVILPSKGQGPFAPAEDNKQRNREIAAIAWIPGTSQALLTDENDDVVRVLDIKSKKVVKTITLPDGAEPVAVAVNETGTTAVVAERERDKVALLDLAALKVSQEVAVGGGPSAVSILGSLALVLNLDTDTVSIVNLTSMSVVGTVDVGRSPRGISSDAAGALAYVTNQSDGTISVIDVAQAKVVKTLQLGADVRPQSILVLPGKGVAVVTEPSRHEGGRVLLVNLTSGAILGEASVNPDRSGGSSEIALFGDTVYFTNQSGGSVTAAQIVLTPAVSVTPRTIKVSIGARALAVDVLDKLLLVTNQGSGEVVLIDLATNTIAGRINGVRGEAEDDDKHDDREDRERAENAPVITTVAPAQAKAGASFAFTISGKNLAGATDVVFLDPASIPGKGHGKEGNGHGPAGKKDPAFTVTNVQANAAGTQVTANVAIAATAASGDRTVRVLTPNGEATGAFKVQ